MALSWSLDELGFSMDYVGTGNAFKELLRGQSEGVGRITCATTRRTSSFENADRDVNYKERKCYSGVISSYE